MVKKMRQKSVLLLRRYREYDEILVATGRRPAIDDLVPHLNKGDIIVDGVLQCW